MTILTVIGGPSAEADVLEKLLKKPLIAGASVSADWSSLSPGKRLALKQTDEKSILTVAQGGRPGLEIMKLLKPETLKDRSILIAIDLLFWDSTLPSPEKSIKSLNELLKKTSKINLPVVLGDIPELLSGRQPSRFSLNKEIQSLCTMKNKCAYLKLDELHRQVIHDGYLQVKGRNLSIRQLVPDGLHLSTEASDELADRLRKVMVENFK